MYFAYGKPELYIEDTLIVIVPGAQNEETVARLAMFNPEVIYFEAELSSV